jgi:hypothetical protein
VEFVGIGTGVYENTLTNQPASKKFTIVDSGGNLDQNGTHVYCLDSNIFGIP